MDFSKMKANATTAFFIVYRDEAATDFKDNPAELMKVTYAGTSDEEYAFTDPTGELRFVHKEEAHEAVAADKKEADKLLATWIADWKLITAREMYEYLTAEFYATTDNQASFDKFMRVAKNKKLLHAMARAIGFEGAKMQGSLAACGKKVRDLRAAMKTDLLAEAHSKIVKSMKKLEATYGAEIKTTDVTAKLEALDKKKAEKEEAKKETKKGKK